MEINARWYENGVPMRIRIEGTRVAEVARFEAGPDRLPWIAPGLLDMQINGYRGQEFSSEQLALERVADIVEATAAFGVTRFLPTVTTQSIEVLTGALRTIDEACLQDPRIAARVAGIHLEGPYISSHDGPRGAHPRPHCHAPDWDEFCRLQEAAGGRIRVLTLSPEYPQAAAFISRVAASGVIVSIGHTAATGRQIEQATDAGATMSTHLGNGSHPLLPRHENYLWAQMAEDRLTAGLIADGHHLPPAVVKSIVRAKQPERCVLVSDVSGYAGLPVGRYQTGLCDLEILPTGKLVVAGQGEILAGASRGLCDGIGNVMSFAGIGLAGAVDMAARRPAEILNLEVACPQAGSAADFIVFDVAEGEAGQDIRIELKQTVGDGQTLWEAPPGDYPDFRAAKMGLSP